jgi:hypothetical protein
MESADEFSIKISHFIIINLRILGFSSFFKWNSKIYRFIVGHISANWIKYEEEFEYSRPERSRIGGKTKGAFEFKGNHL